MAPVIERGSGCRVWDIDGNEYVEFGSGLRSNMLGHGFEPVVRAVRVAGPTAPTSSARTASSSRRRNA